MFCAANKDSSPRQSRKQYWTEAIVLTPLRKSLLKVDLLV